MGNITLALLDAGGLATVERYLQEAERATLRARDSYPATSEPSPRVEIRCASACGCRRSSRVAEFALHGSPGENASSIFRPDCGRPMRIKASWGRWFRTS